MSLQAILADYIRLVEPLLAQTSNMDNAGPGLTSAMNEVFCEGHIRYLTVRGYSPVDVMSWAWIFSSNTVYEAVLRIFILQGDHRTKHGPVQEVPPFIPLLLLRHKSLDAKTLRLLLIYSIHLLNGQPLPAVHSSIKPASDGMDLPKIQPSEPARPPVDPTMCTTFVVRLLYHARQVWPQAQLAIARAFAIYLTLPDPKESSSVIATQKMNQFRAEKFNTCLWLLSLPSKPGPFMSASIQQEAQFELLKAMAGHTPALPVTRRGYQGVVAVQLAHKKTSAERQSAELKAPSWPPWKEERLGIDSQRGIEGMKSRAMRVMSQMKEAGYSHTRWEEVSTILAGWDTDQSPTVQTRSLTRRPQSLSGPRGSKPGHQSIWVARIRATRTVREAWACFLSYQDQGLPPSGAMYAIMAEKLIFRRKAVEGYFDENSHALPGDGPEVFPEPSSARDLIYVPTEPPTLDELLNQMLSQGIRPSGRFLALLLRSASSFSVGLDYLNCSNLSDNQIQALSTVWGQQSDYNTQARKALNELPDYLFSSFISFLCNCSDFNRLYLARHNIRTADLFPVIMSDYHTIPSKTTTLSSYVESLGASDDLHHPKTLPHAVQLIKLRHSRYPPAWIHLLSALSKDRISVPYRKMSRGVQRVLAWHEVIEVMRWMKDRDVEPGLQGFHLLCTSFSKAVVAGVRHPDAAEEGLDLVSEASQRRGSWHAEHVCLSFDDMVQTGLCTLKDYFDQLVLPDAKTSHIVERSMTSVETATNSQVTVPPMLHVPSPAVLHAFVRALGLAEDHDGLLNLLRWMSQSATTLKEASDEYLNGERMMRRTLVAIRVFLEGSKERRFLGSSNPSYFNDSEVVSFSDPNVQEAYDIFTATPLWGSWPSEEEVWDYVHWEHPVQ
ncbi:hypothetical protein AWENTII_001304 [Aspergillus wentii]